MTRLDKLLAGMAASRAFMVLGTVVTIAASAGMAAIHVAGRARMSIIDRSWWVGSNVLVAAALLVALVFALPKLATLACAVSSGVWLTWGVLATVRAQMRQPPGTLDPGFTSIIISAWVLLMAAAWSEVRVGRADDTAASNRSPASVRVVGVDGAGDVGLDRSESAAGNADAEGVQSGRG